MGSHGKLARPLVFAALVAALLFGSTYLASAVKAGMEFEPTGLMIEERVHGIPGRFRFEYVYEPLLCRAWYRSREIDVTKLYFGNPRGDDLPELPEDLGSARAIFALTVRRSGYLFDEKGVKRGLRKRSLRVVARGLVTERLRADLMLETARRLREKGDVREAARLFLGARWTVGWHLGALRDIFHPGLIDDTELFVPETVYGICLRGEDTQPTPEELRLVEGFAVERIEEVKSLEEKLLGSPVWRELREER